MIDSQESVHVLRAARGEVWKAHLIESAIDRPEVGDLPRSLPPALICVSSITFTQLVRIESNCAS